MKIIGHCATQETNSMFILRFAISNLVENKRFFTRSWSFVPLTPLVINFAGLANPRTLLT